ncbi:FtsW/RodA/SpoVE family cell cycle protein, partial [Prevotella sp. MGM2]|uniref:FtsW/RodA/SpoVE family cell cycle protein n=1 Tax=Prevotella sp. MGM2 TaxID=2033406 RepID=UPI0016819BAE
MDISSRRIFQGDTVIWVVFFLLCMISLIEVFSAASTLTYKSGDFMAPFFKQLLFLGLGTGVAWFFHAIPCRYFKIIPLFFLPLCIVLLLVTLFFGSSENGGARWLDLGIRFQPSELAKGVVIVSVALILSHMQREEGADRRAFKLILTITGIVCTLIVSENLSTAAILFTTVFIMMF